MLGYTWFFGYLSAALSLVAYSRYIYTIRKGTSQPSKASWIVWSVVGVMIALSYYYSGGGDSVPATVVYALGPPVVLFFVFKGSTWEMEWGEWGAVAFSVLALLLWWHYRSAVLGLYIEIVADLLGAWGTIVHAYQKPSEEDTPTWAWSQAGAVVNLFAVDVWSIGTPKAFVRGFYPCIVVAMCSVILLLSLRKPRFVKETAESA